MLGVDLFGNTGLIDSLPEHLKENRSVQVLEKSLQNGRLAHGILLHGESLEELSEIALSIASVLLNTTKEKAQDHPDLFTLRPAKKARQIRISGDAGKAEPNTMRWLLKDIMQSSNQGGHKVAIIYEADRMNTSTANAFLKTLEEPPEDTTLLLVTTRPYDLLDTIRSRCFNFRLKSSTGTYMEEGWQNWLDSYAQWLEKLSHFTRGASSKDRSDTVMHVYGLISRFNQSLKEISGETWKKEKESIPEYLSSEEKDALETGIRKGIRQRLWADIETVTCQFSRRLLTNNEPHTRALGQAVKDLEHAMLLNSVFNFKEDAALELFLLNSLRNWTRG